MYNPQTGTLLLGTHYTRNRLVASHAEEHGRLGNNEPFDDFIRGWIGYGGIYAHGVIHFAPHITKANMDYFCKAFSTLEMFAANGAKENTVIRGFPTEWEQPFSNIIKILADNQ